jgi:hypothetical protein
MMMMIIIIIICESVISYSSNWNRLKITQTIPEQRTGKTRNPGTTQTSHTGPCTHTADSAKYKTYLTCEITLRVAQTVNTKQLQHYVP